MHRPLPTKVHLVKAMVFPVVMCGCESWTVKKAEHQGIDAFELWCWRRLLRVPWTARTSNQSILKEISPGCSLEGLMLMLKLQYFGHLLWRVDSLEKTLMLGGIGGRRRRGWQRMRWLDGIIDSMDMSFSELWELVVGREAWRAAIHGITNSQTRLRDWTDVCSTIKYSLVLQGFELHVNEIRLMELSGSQQEAVWPPRGIGQRLETLCLLTTEWGDATGFYKAEARDAAKHLKTHKKESLIKNYWAKNVNSAKVEKTIVQYFTLRLWTTKSSHRKYHGYS